MSEKNNQAEYLFHQGTNYHAYDYLGCNLTVSGGKYIYTFRTWAPNADEVYLVADFTDWHNNAIKMSKESKGIWGCTVTADTSYNGNAYKYFIKRNGVGHLKGDPYARFSRGGADGASVIYAESNHTWDDKTWLKSRKKTVFAKGGYLASPLNIYEVHAGSFMRKEDNKYLTYRELADTLIPYLKHMGYTHVEFLPLAEHPFDGSWGYQVGAFYAPTSRFGTPDDFKYLVNELHKAGLGIIIDWVPAHFPKDEWCLYEYDGAPLYEYQGKDRMESSSWGTRFFDLGREEVQSFLISNALYMFREFHVDGLRVDAVASMIYLDYDRRPDEWVPNAYGGRENLEAIAFLRKLNIAIYDEFPEALMIAEESGSFNGITKPAHEGGLGFNLKWNMGFANDFYDYVETDPFFRKYKHTALNFPIMYAFNENYVLPISHDEVVHGKKSFVDKMYGSYEDKFRQARTAMMLIMTYPGKKMLFMGTEYAQFREWDYDNSLEWFMLDYPNHRLFRQYVSALNRFYLDTKELWTYDFTPNGFEWIYADEAERNIVAYKRKADKSEIIVAVNFSGSTQTVRINVKSIAPYKRIFSTDVVSEENALIDAKRDESGAYFDVILPAFSGSIYKRTNKNKIIKI